MGDCSQHKKEVAGISDMKELAEMIGDLHYKTLSILLYHLSDKLYYDGLKDFHSGRTQLAGELFKSRINIHEAHTEIERAWKLSEPYMKAQLSEPKVE